MELTDADRRILMALQGDATLTLKQLAGRLAMSQSTVWRRIQELEAAEVIAQRVTLVDPAKAGLSVCIFVNVDLADHQLITREGFEAFVRDCDQVMECFSITGAHDYMLIVRTKTVEAFDHFLMHRLLTRAEVASAHSNLTLRQQKYSTVLPL